MKRMNEHGITIYIKSTVQQLVDRLHVEKETRPLIAGMNDEVLSQFIEAKLAERQSCYLQAMYHLPAAYMSLDNFQKIIRRNG
jgi:shikimate kinase